MTGFGVSAVHGFPDTQVIQIKLPNSIRGIPARNVLTGAVDVRAIAVAFVWRDGAFSEIYMHCSEADPMHW